ncbi:unnamed protein product, partial [Mesorhabditis belari]|uniref:MADF domain-containing protein n=1 Tax=Mesorhabditis belari TaxID=2138241 RepID=A0AAF3F548_9BILA
MLSAKHSLWFDANEEPQKPKRVYSRGFKLRLIEEVRKRPYLWDPSDEQYGNQTINRKAWMDICNVMNTVFHNDDPMHPQLARKNFKNLRDMFKTRWLESKMGKTSAQRWDYFIPMNFLADVFEKNEDNLDMTTFLNEQLLNGTEDDGTNPSNEEIDLASLLFKRNDDKDDLTVFDYSNDGDEFDAIKRISEQFNSPSTSTVAPLNKRARIDNRFDFGEKLSKTPIITQQQGITNVLKKVSPNLDVAAAAFLNDQDFSKGVTLNFYSCDQQDVQQTVGLFSVGATLDNQHCQQNSVTFGSYHSTKVTVAKVNIAELTLGVPEDLYNEFVTQFNVDPKEKFPLVNCNLDFGQLQMGIGNATMKFSASIYIDRISISPPTCRLIAYPIKASGFQNSWVFGYSLIVDKCLFLGWDRQVIGFADAKTSNC